MIRKIVPPLLLLCSLLAVPVLAQDGWPPDWVFTPYWPPGEYPVWGTPGGILLWFQEPVTLVADGSPIGDPLFYSASCMDAACNEILVSCLTFGSPGAGEMPMNWLFIIKKGDWLPILNPTATPPGTSTATPVVPTSTPPPIVTPTPDVTCPADVIQQAPPRAEKVGVFPPNPVVKGQGGQGLTITFRVTSFPVVRHWWEKVDNSRWACVHIESGFEDDGRYGVNPCSAGWEGWENRYITDVKCEERIQIIPDPIRVETFQAHARLLESSKRWIEGELQQRYPGARVRKPNWDVSGQVQTNGCAANGQCVLVVTAYFPFEDPGWYDVWAEGQTSGTAYTPPRTFRYQSSQPQPVYLMDSTLLPDW